MLDSTPMFRLKIQQVDVYCLVDLSWGQGQSLSVQLPYPEAVIRAYEKWLRAYVHFYQTLSPPVAMTPAPQTPLRGQVAQTGGLTPLGVDWQAELVKAEAQLLYQFHQWLRRAELFEIRAIIANAARTAVSTPGTVLPPVELFLVCGSIELTRLPWETWEIGAEFGTTGVIRIARCPDNVHGVPGPPRSPHQRLRVLAILGDEQGLDFEADCEALRLLAPLAEVQFVGGMSSLAGSALKHKICEALTDPRGWDLLFFAGHSEETDLTGGELVIAPDAKLFIHEIAPQLATAKERGLQLAIFNSCSGLSIASTLIDLGLSQVVIMREPIPNRIAQTFLLHFLKHLLAYADTHDALRSTCQFLRLEQSISLPSAYLIPSLFRHPQTKLLQLQRRGVQRWVRPWKPVRREVIAVLSLLFLSLCHPVQDFLLEHRILAQALYRDLTNQVSPQSAAPPVLLVHVDSESIRRSNMVTPKPMDRTYLAKLVNRLAKARTPVVGIDYLFDRQHPRQDQTLAQSVHQSIADQQTWFVFAALQDPDGKDVGVHPETNIAPSQASLQAHIKAFPNYLKLAGPEQTCQQSCPFAYLLALVASYTQTIPNHQVQPELDASNALKTRLFEDIRWNAVPGSQLEWLHQLRLHPITEGASDLGQLWLYPILDFSIPPHQIYDRLPAWSLLEESIPAARIKPSPSVVMIAAGGYDGAGISQPDYFPVPPAMKYWRERLQLSSQEDSEVTSGLADLPRFTGGEAHAYMIHHLLTRRLVIPIPDAWLVLLAAILGKATILPFNQMPLKRQGRLCLSLGLLGGTGIYLLLGWQLYISAAVLLPWLFPVAIVWLYVLPIIWRKDYD